MRLCAICQRGVREGDASMALRVEPSDFTPEVLHTLRMTQPPQRGLYHACPECIQAALPGLIVRVNAEHGTKFTVETLPANFLV